MMIKKKILLLGLAITIVLAGLTGCAEQTTTQSETTTPQVVTGQEETSSEEETTEKTTEENETVGGVMGYVDAEDIFRHISIKGEYVNKYPWTLDSLGDKFAVDTNVSIDLEEKKANTFLMFEGQGVAMISGKIDTQFTESSIIYRIYPFYGIENIMIYDLSNNSTEKDVIERFGEPSLITKGKKEDYYLYETENIKLELEFDSSTTLLCNWTIELTEECIKKIQEENEYGI